MRRTTVVVALPPGELEPVSVELRGAGFEVLPARRPEHLEAILAERSDVNLAILDGETDFDTSLEYWSLLREGSRQIRALMVVAPGALEALLTGAGPDDEFFTRPYSAESLRWRVEAMCIRSQVVDDGSGPVLSGDIAGASWSRRATVVAVFNPKGGVGKTTIATNLAAALAMRKGKRVLLVDADTVTGHVTTSLALEAVTTVADAWRDEAEGGEVRTLDDLAAPHPSGMRVISLTTNPLDTEILAPERVGDAILAMRQGFDFIIVDLHPSYSPLNQAIFARVDRILVPVTPDVPAIRAAVQLRDVAAENGFRDRLALVVNRANSGVSVEDLERTVGMESYAQIRSGGLLFVRAATEGRTIIDMYPREKITEDFDALADRIVGVAVPEEPDAAGARAGFGLFGRRKAPVRA